MAGSGAAASVCTPCVSFIGEWPPVRRSVRPENNRASILGERQIAPSMDRTCHRPLSSLRASSLRATGHWAQLYSTLLLLSCCCLFSGLSVIAIKINRFQVPEAVERGKSALLHCDYSLENGEELYSIKLYKNNVEFYRYVPGENPAKQSYKLNGIYVNLTESNSTHAVLSRTNLHSDGLYICEISTEGPSFSTVRSEQLMKIYVLPNESVQIEGAFEPYNYGDNISLVCKSGKTWPQTKLQWFINDHPVDSKYTIKLSAERSPSGLEASRLGLNIYAKANDFIRGVLQIKCTATLTIVYEYESTEHLVTGSFKNKSIGRVNWRKEWSLQPNTKTPVIVGMKRNYLLNDILKLNCSTSMRSAKLKWFIMNKEVNDTHLIRYEYYNGKNNQILGLWLRMEKKLIQMADLRLRCQVNFSKQIAQFHSKLPISTYDNQSWESTGSAAVRSASSSGLLLCWSVLLLLASTPTLFHLVCSMFLLQLGS